MSFSYDVAKLSKKIGKSLGDTVIGIKIDLFNGVIRDTRVDTGRLRGNWQTTTGAEASGTLDRLDGVNQGSDGGDAQADVEKTVKPDTVDYLTNNLAYAEVYEEKDAMIEKNLTRINRIIKKQIRGL